MQKKRVLTFLTCLSVVVAGLAHAVAIQAMPSNQTSVQVFKTPEDAIATFFEGIRRGDVEKIFSACAIDEISENYKFDLTIDRLQAFVPFQLYGPTNYPLYVELNRSAVASRISSQVKLFAFSLLSSEAIDFSVTTRMNGDGARAFVKEVDPSRLVGLELKKIDLPNKPMMKSTRYLENAAKAAATYGADESTERVALFSFEQNDYVLGFTLLRYGDNWKISSASSPMAGTNSMGTPEKTTPDDFEALIQ